MLPILGAVLRVLGVFGRVSIGVGAELVPSRGAVRCALGVGAETGADTESLGAPVALSVAAAAGALLGELLLGVIEGVESESESESSEDNGGRDSVPVGARAAGATAAGIAGCISDAAVLAGAGAGAVVLAAATGVPSGGARVLGAGLAGSAPVVLGPAGGAGDSDVSGVFAGCSVGCWDVLGALGVLEVSVPAGVSTGVLVSVSVAAYGKNCDKKRLRS